MSCRRNSLSMWLWSVALAVLSAGPVAAQPPSPLELVRGLRENGQVDLALEYLKELEAKPLSPDDKAAILLERSKCLLDASDDEADEGTRQGIITEAKEGLNTFVRQHPNHPRAVEGLLALAKLRSLDAKEQLSVARRMEVPDKGDADEKEREAALTKQFEAAKKAQPLFQLASKMFSEASGILRTKLEDTTLDPRVRRTLEREAFEAELASGINQFSIAETFMPDEILNGAQKGERNKLLEQAKEIFDKLARGPQNNRTVWVARAWVAEVTYEQNKFNEAAEEVAQILKSTMTEAEDGKRMARFFKLRRNVKAALGTRDRKKIDESESEMRAWISQYGNLRKPTPEAFTVRFYLARTLHFVAEAMTPASKDATKPTPITGTARGKMAEAEKLYRILAQTDNEYTARATRSRMIVVRRMLGDAAQPPHTYTTFETAQLASLIQFNRLSNAEKKLEQLQGDAMPDEKKLEAARKEIKTTRQNVIALLERARELITPQDNPADVVDVLLRLIHFYRENDQFYQAAVLGDASAHTIRSTGGKAAIAGFFGLVSYLDASRVARVKDDDLEALVTVRQIDRDRAIALAKFLEQKYPNDNGTDAARYRIADILIDRQKYEQDKLLQAYGFLINVRPSSARITDARLLQGYVVSRLIGDRESTLPSEEKLKLYRRALSDLVKVPVPPSVALESDVRGYLMARCRLAQMLLSQSRADPAADKANSGYSQAMALAEKILAEVPTFDCMTEMKDGMKKFNLDGMEMNFLALEAYNRALYLHASALVTNKQSDAASKLIQPTIEHVQKTGALFTEELKAWAGGGGSGEPDAKQKARIGALAEFADRARVDVVLVGFRLKVEQGNAAEATTVLDLVEKAGGTIEANLPLLIPVGRELAVRMVLLQREGNDAEAKKLGDGLAVLLNKIRNVKDLSVSARLFVGQTLQTVGKNDEAIETLKLVPAPTFKGWENAKPADIPQEEKGKVEAQIRNYAFAQLAIAKALRGKQSFAEAENMLKGIIGTNEKQGWGYGRLYFREELAELYEAKGAASRANVKQANIEWGSALREWNGLLAIYRGRLQRVAKDATPQQIADLRNGYANAFFDVSRCVVVANQQLTSGPKLQKTFDDTGRKFAEMEKQITLAEWDPEVQNRYADLIKATPPLKNTYVAAGGKLFLERLPPRPK